MKKLYIILGIVIVSVASILLFNNNDKVKYIDYNGSKLAISVDGENVDTMPSGKYFLISYECRGETKISWNYETSTLTYNNINANDHCSLTFESSPKLYDLVNIGNYISYTGDSTNGCTENQCSGWNANQTATDLYENYGGCSTDTKNRFTTYGWRVLYKEDNSVYIVSAGAPECVTSTANNNTQTISDLDAAALKYCNELYQSNGECNYDTAHPFNDDDFYNFTSQYYGINNGRHLSSSYGTSYCYDSFKGTFCGYNNDIMANDGYYWFGSKYSSTNTNNTLYWNSGYRYVYCTDGPFTYGLRPVLKLDSSILATGGAGTMTNPYTISERVTTE